LLSILPGVAVASTSRGTSHLSVRVSPNAPRNEIAGFAEGVLRVKVAAPPEKGKANRELVSFLSRVLDVNSGSLTVIRGHTGRSKLVTVSGLSQEELLRRLGLG
jgi:uncharacterized protein (TIGR00251 family)